MRKKKQKIEKKELRQVEIVNRLPQIDSVYQLKEIVLNGGDKKTYTDDEKLKVVFVIFNLRNEFGYTIKEAVDIYNNSRHQSEPVLRQLTVEKWIADMELTDLSIALNRVSADHIADTYKQMVSDTSVDPANSRVYGDFAKWRTATLAPEYRSKQADDKQGDIEIVINQSIICDKEKSSILDIA